ncbi:MAG: FAD-binding oxidoreductase [Thermoplasmata archaeon]|nr:FAD-binding oxidoreductase [Thermoplasmata archaeon]
MPTEAYETLILGAGLAGCALAVHLARRSAGPTLLLDPRTLAGGATGRAAGIVTDQMWDRWDVAVTQETDREYERRGSRLGPGAYRRTGFLRWTHRAEFVPLIEQAAKRFSDWGVAARLLDASELRSRFPWGKFEEGVRGLYSPDAACVNPTELATDYLEEARREGARVELSRAVPPPHRESGAWQLAFHGEELRARRLVIAAGAWSKRVAAEVGFPLALAPYRTQAALLRPPQAPPASFPAAHDVDLDVYLRPEEAGRILVGDGTELKEVDPDRVEGGGTPEFLAHIGSALAERWPGWADSELNSAWSGVCDATPDRRPLIGPLDEEGSLFVLAGFNGFGVMRADGAARRLADLLVDGPGERASEALRTVRPDRFGPAPPAFEPRPGFTLEDGPSPRC